MGHNKMEREFRQKLESREIQPSDSAWDRLDAMLTVAEKKNEKPVFSINWLLIAAGFVGILLMATIFFKQSDKNTQPEDRVVIENQAPKAADPVNESGVAPKGVAAPNEAVVEAERKEPKQQNVQNQYGNRIITQPLHAPKSAEAIADSETKKSPSDNIQKPTIKAPEVNVDELLASVDSKHKNFQKPEIKVDAGSLLSQVDGEIELSFREKVIRTVSKNYKNVKVALANRNQE